ncbi:MAG: Serine/threonine-protein kinase PknD [Chroococcidiopsis cubana SAG 39.79]|uniref:Serine/threonine protein kinase n=1 Tax=Chroococcidiopsis cubana SAG 39.79 TaxID=388085 RepID=A0AB37UIM9_9CYAN|nr:serine/threonine-protein kinase [Chroococcidiopsis cubana]MDZ4877425.1 Serine/threonine-protein kinase PknD [Chroococcidiopsis cubana SAG 39.79]RUT11236.1 serine/threonine protein kinase [Chroococcidiopsis cubana SAG 39.79]
MKGEQIIQPLSKLDPFGYGSSFWIGRSIGDRQRYCLKRCLGEGSMGYVFLAIDTKFNDKQVALKLLQPKLAESAELKQRFKDEIEVCVALESYNIVKVSDYGVTTEGLPFYVMEYLHGQSLGQLLHQQRQLPVERAVNIITQVCDGLSLAHKGVNLWQEKATVSEYIHVQVFHRDLKPDNIFLVPTARGELVKILDFGIAKICKNQEYNSLTKFNGFLGTHHYAAPEQLEGANIDERADIYSLGIILYEMLSGTNPFGLGLNTCNIDDNIWILAHTGKQVKTLRSQPGLSDISDHLEAIVLKCLEKSPSDRFDSVDDLNKALQAATTNKTDTVLPPTPIQHNNEDRTTIRPLVLLQPSGDRAIEPPVESVDLGVSDTVLSLQKDSLVEILTEIIGSIALDLVEEKAAQASSTKELVNKLLPYLSSLQQIEFEERARVLLQKYTAQTQNMTEQIQVIDTKFLQQCEECLTEIVGSIANSLIQEVMKSHPQISPIELVNVLAENIPNSGQAEEFVQQFTD